VQSGQRKREEEAEKKSEQLKKALERYSKAAKRLGNVPEKDWKEWEKTKVRKIKTKT